MNSTATAAAAGLAVGVGAMGCRPLFTASQWQELEHQALIFKYMMAGIPVPPDLLLPIRQSFDSMAAPRMMSYPHPTLGYCSFYGKKLDPEPGRCRRTDGKKWRCSKEAYPDSKYCERHMHRGRNRSRKPVESQALSQSHQQKSTSPSSSTVTSLNPTATNGTVGNNRGGAVGSFHSGGSSSSSSSIPLNSSIAGVHNRVSSEATNLTQLHMDSGSYSGIGNKEFRYIPGLKSEVDTSSYFCGGVENARGLGINSSLDNSWGHMPSRISAFPLSKDRNGSLLSSGYSQLDSLQDIGQESLSLLSKLQQQPQHCFFGSDYVSSEIPKQGSQSLRPFFDEWPKTRNSWSELEDEQSNRSSFSTTHLSISIPMASSDFSTTGSRSPNAE